MLTSSKLDLTNQQYLTVLKTQYTRLSNDDKIHLSLYDCNSVGEKDTTANYGLCTNELEIWNTKDLNLHEEEFESHQTVSPKYFAEKQFCPFDAFSLRENFPYFPENQELEELIQSFLTRKFNELMNDNPMGCFYRCLLFQNWKKIINILKQQDATKLYKFQIRKFEAGNEL